MPYATERRKEMPTESETRKEIIDFRLKLAGWNVTDRTQVVEKNSLSPQPRPQRTQAHPAALFQKIPRNSKALAATFSWARTASPLPSSRPSDLPPMQNADVSM